MEVVKARRKKQKITFSVRQQIETKLDEGKRIMEIAEEVGFPYQTVYREVMKNGGLRLYNAEEAQHRL